MKVLVCVSVVPDTVSTISFNENDINYENIPLILNPNDEYNLSKIVSIKKNNDLDIVVINVGEERNNSIIKKCLAIGADSAVRINNKAKNSFSVGNLLSEYILENKFDLIMLGKESIDFNGNCIYGIISGITNIQMLNDVVDLEINKNSISIKIEKENNLLHINHNLPAIISSKKGIIEEKDIIIPNMRGIISAKQKDIKIIEKNNYENNFYSYEKYETIEEKEKCKIFNTPKELITNLKNDKIL